MAFKHEDLLRDSGARIEADAALRRASERLARARSVKAEAEGTLARLQEEAAQDRERAGGAVEALLEGRPPKAVRDLAGQVTEAWERLTVARQAEKQAAAEADHARAVAAVGVTLDPRVQKVFADMGRRVTLCLIALTELGGERCELFDAAARAGIVLGRVPNVPNPSSWLGNERIGDGRVRGFVEDGLRSGQISKSDLPKTWLWALQLADRIARERSVRSAVA